MEVKQDVKYLPTKEKAGKGGVFAGVETWRREG